MARFTGGWVKVYRQLLKSDIGGHPTRLSLFLHLLTMANIEDTWVDWQGAPRRCPRGSLVTSYRELSKLIGAARSSIERQLNYLHQRDTVKVESETRGTFVTINNYSDYQDIKEASGTKSRRKRDDHDATAEATGEASNEELKKKRIKEQIEEIYKAFYPLKKGKSKGVEKLLKEMKTDEDIKNLKTAVIRYKDDCIKQKTESKFIMHFSTFANEWEDWLDPEVGKSTSQTVQPQDPNQGVTF